MSCEDVEPETPLVLYCDGCAQIREVTILTDYGHEVRYCAECRDIYVQWAAAMKAEEMRLQRAFDLHMLETRRALTLNFAPIDIPPAKPGLDGMRLA